MTQLRIPIKIGAPPSASFGALDGVRWETGWPGLLNTLATNDIALAVVRSLRRQAYRSVGVLPSPEVIGDEFDGESNSRIFVLSDNALPVGTIRILVGNREEGLRTFFSDHFTGEIAEHIGEGNYIEVSRLAIRHSDGARDPRHVLALMQNVTSEADINSSRCILAPMDREHYSFYASLGFQPITDARQSPGWPQRISVGCLDWFQERHRLRHHAGFRYFFSARNHGR